MNIRLSYDGDSVQADCLHLTPKPNATARRSYARAMLFAVSAFLASTSALSAQNKNELEIRLTAQRVVREKDKETFESADLAGPGDVVVYSATVRNNALRPLQNIAPTLPIPVGTQYVAGSANPAPVEASLDGKVFEAMPILRPTVLPDGRKVNAPVPASSYRALRWNIDQLAAEASFVAAARVQVVAK